LFWIFFFHLSLKKDEDIAKVLGASQEGAVRKGNTDVIRNKSNIFQKSSSAAKTQGAPVLGNWITSLLQLLNVNIIYL